MMTAKGYGNAAAYFNNNFNNSTSFQLGIAGGLAGKRPVSAYSVVRQGGVAVSLTTRIGSPSAAVIGWLGHRPVAFPLVTGWNFDTPLT